MAEFERALIQERVKAGLGKLCFSGAYRVQPNTGRRPKISGTPGVEIRISYHAGRDALRV